MEPKDKDAFLREMERKSLDIFMVYNPTDKDYFLEWDKRYHRIPARDKDMGFGPGKMELERYLTEKYAREMKNYLINEMAKKQGEDLIAKRKAEGKPDFLDKFEENKEVWDKVYKTNNPKLIEEVYGDVVLGLVREYGLDRPEDLPGEVMDTKTPEERIMENMKKQYKPEVPVDEKPKKPTHPPKPAVEMLEL